MSLTNRDIFIGFFVLRNSVWSTKQKYKLETAKNLKRKGDFQLMIKSIYETNFNYCKSGKDYQKLQTKN